MQDFPCDVPGETPAPGTFNKHLFTSALHALEQRHLDEADNLARQGIASIPDDGRFWQVHGTARWAMGDWSCARQALETASTLMPLFPLARCALAECYTRLGQLETARAMLGYMAQEDRFPDALLPKVAAGLGRLEENHLALQVCRKLARRRPSHHAALFGIAYYLARLNYPTKAYVRRLVQAQQLAPDMLLYRVNLAFAWSEMKRWRKAHELVKDLPACSIPCRCWLHGLMRIFERVGNDQQWQEYEKELEERPERS